MATVKKDEVTEEVKVEEEEVKVEEVQQELVTTDEDFYNACVEDENVEIIGEGE